MPRIDPFQLLKCLSVLLGPSGGIKSKEEVQRLATLMTKFSKKLVSKCIYIQILKTTDTELLSLFMDAGGWSLIHMWLTDGIVAKNWALIQELLELLHLCPVKIERLKSNNCPKLIKGLSKEVTHQGVRQLAGRLVEQWLKIVKGEAAPNSVPAHIIGNLPLTTSNMDQPEHHYNSSPVTKNDLVEDGINETIEQNHEEGGNKYDPSIEAGQGTVEKIHGQPMQLQVQNVAHQPQQIGKQPSYVLVTSKAPTPAPFPVCKITIRDGNEVLVKVETDASNINSVLKGKSSHEMNGELKQEMNDEKVEHERLEKNDTEGDCAVNDNSSEVNQPTKDSGNVHVNDNKINKDDINKNVKDTVSSDSNKSSDKENRDSHKTDDKKSSGSNSSLDKKSSSDNHRSSKGSSSSSSKHSSSSHRTSSSSHRSSSHRSGSGSGSKSSSSRDKSSRDKDRHHSSSSSSSKHSSSSKNKSDRDKEREKEKEKLKKDQAEKDKATLEKVQAQAISSKLGKIPKKKSEDEKTGSDTLIRKSSTESRDSSKENKEKSDTKKSVQATILEKKNISISIENRKNSQDSTRPKTVKTFNSKFRSTGLEEEVKPPPPRSAAKKPVASPVEKKILPPAKPALPSLKRTSPLRETSVPSDKRAKLSLEPPVTSPTEEKKGAIKLIAPKPKPMVLQESDMFMDALTASTKAKEPRKRKRRTSITKDGPGDSKKSDHTNADGGHDSPSHPSSPPSADERSPLVVKPNFKFYQDTLETDEDKEDKEKLDERIKKEKSEESDKTKDEGEENDDYEACLRQVAKSEAAGLPGKNELKKEDDDSEKTKGSDSSETEDPTSGISDLAKKERSLSPNSEIRYVDGLRSVLLLQKRKGPKKSLKWKTDLESVRYFELDETERVNVTKTFTDMKQMEKQGEREAFQMARKLSTEDTMEEKTCWKPLIPIDLQPALVEPGKDSREKDIQYAREKGILQALYFNRSMIPDSAAEPDEERHHGITDPKTIPLEDLTGNKDSEKDFTGVPWPEPKVQLPPQIPNIPPPGGYHFPGAFPHNQPPMMPPMGPPGPPGPMGQMPPMQQGPMMGPGPMNQMGPDMGVQMNPPNMGGGGGGGGGWRTGDGKVVVPDVGPMNPMQQPMPNMPGGFPPGGMEGGPMMPPGMMGPPMFNQQEGFGMMGPEDMGFGNFQGPPGPGMFGPGPNFQGPPRGGGPMHGNRGRGGGPGWFRGGGVAGGPMRGGGGNGGGWRGGWRGNGKQPPICRQFTKNGFCRIGDKCQYLHPGVNCPPF